MYLDFEDYRPDIQPIGRAPCARYLISIIVHLVATIFVLLIPRLFPYDPNAARQQVVLPDTTESPRFVFVQPRVDRTAPKPRLQADPSDKDRVARSRERKPDAIEPFSRENYPVRQAPLRGTQPGRAVHQQNQTLSPHRHTLRENRAVVSVDAILGRRHDMAQVNVHRT
jgi:hypothetical protein